MVESQSMWTGNVSKKLECYTDFSKGVEQWNVYPTGNHRNWEISIDEEQAVLYSDIYGIPQATHGYKNRIRVFNQEEIPIQIFIPPKTDEDRQFIETISEYYRVEEKEKAVGFVYEYFGDLIVNQKFDRCNKVLGEILEKGFTTWILLPFLTLTKFYKKEIPNRSVLFENAVLQFLETMEVEQAKATIKRLV